MSIRIAPLLIAAACAFSGPADAQTLYKLIDKNGKVTYSQNPPKDFDGKVIPMNIDPNANTATLPKLEAAPREAAGAPAKQDRLERAKVALEKAKKNLQEARENPAPDDIQRMGIVKGGTRPVFSPEYEKRIAGLEEAVKAAEKELREAEKSGS